MPSDQTLIFIIFALLFVLLVWGRFRYDLVAFGALVVAAALGLVPKADVFSGRLSNTAMASCRDFGVRPLSRRTSDSPSPAILLCDNAAMIPVAT